jgi:Tfp pilus assembly protein PilO
MTPNETGWHLDRKVPIGIIAAMFVQCAGALWFVSKLDARILALEGAQSTQRERDERQDRSNSDALTQLHRQLERIDEKLDRLIEKGRK